MTWFAAHVITLLPHGWVPRNAQGLGERHLVEASYEDASMKAEVYGRNRKATAKAHLMAQRPATCVFAGIRKLVRCDSDCSSRATDGNHLL